jgi:hypothetical protein
LSAVFERGLELGHRLDHLIFLSHAIDLVAAGELEIRDAAARNVDALWNRALIEGQRLELLGRIRGVAVLRDLFLGLGWRLGFRPKRRWWCGDLGLTVTAGGQQQREQGATHR